MGRQYQQEVEQAATGKSRWIQPVRRGYRIRCCDCALVHGVDFRIFNGRVQFRAYRDSRATAACRRRLTKSNASALPSE